MKWLRRLSHDRLVWLVELFAIFNLAFLAVDILIAHAANDFHNPVEWLPVGFSTVAPLVLVPRLWGRPLPHDGLVGWGSILMGVAGMVFHLDSAFFGAKTIHSLVYAAPFVAPLSYTGIGLLILLNRAENESPDNWARWVLFLAAAGFVGNFGLSLLDHAQNGFFLWTEWIPVCGAAVAAAFLVVAVARPAEPTHMWACIGIMGLQMLLGVGGAALHLLADVPAESLWDKLVYGPPAFAPLLFADLAVLGLMGVGALWMASHGAVEADA